VCDPKKDNTEKWLFDWGKEVRQGYDVRALRVEGEPDIKGLMSYTDNSKNLSVWLNLAEASPENNKKNPSNNGVKEYSGIGGHLTAIGVKESYEELGYNGVVEFEAKTELIEYYK